MVCDGFNFGVPESCVDLPRKQNGMIFMARMLKQWRGLRPGMMSDGTFGLPESIYA